MLQNLEILAREAKSWPFEQARNLLAHVLKKRLGESERAEARARAQAPRPWASGRLARRGQAEAAGPAHVRPRRHTPMP